MDVAVGGLGAGWRIAVEESLIAGLLEKAIGAEAQTSRALGDLSDDQFPLRAHDRLDGHDLFARNAETLQLATQRDQQVLKDAQGNAADEWREQLRLGVEQRDVTVD